MRLVIPKSFWAHTFVCKNIRKLIYWAGALAKFFVILLSFERIKADSWAFISKRRQVAPTSHPTKSATCFFPSCTLKHQGNATSEFPQGWSTTHSGCKYSSSAAKSRCERRPGPWATSIGWNYMEPNFQREVCNRRHASKQRQWRMDGNGTRSVGPVESAGGRSKFYP